LVATEPGRSSREGRASLGTDKRNPQTYAAGALLANGMVLEEIYSEYVVLSRNGKRFVLGFDGNTPIVSATQRSFQLAEGELLVGGNEYVKRPLELIPTSREDLSYLIRAEPIFEHDLFAGLRILPGTDGSRLAVLDLKSGDIVRAIDGKPVRSPDEAWQTLDDAISTGTPIIISIDRDGSLMSMSLDGSRLNAHEDQMPSLEMRSASPGS
jgi:type II secretory pathway component PulC